MKDIILIVDDNWIIKEEIEKNLRANYAFIRACSYKNSIELLEENKVSLVFLNVSLDFTKDIIDFLSFSDYLVPVIFVCENSTLYYSGYVLHAYINLPLKPHLLLNQVSVLIELCNYRKTFDDFKNTQERKTNEIADVFSSTVCTLIEYRNIESTHHVKRIKGYTKCILEFLSNNLYDDELTKRNIDVICTASMLHDIGLIGVPDALISKTAPLSIDEEVMLSNHTIIGCRIIEKLKITDTNEFFITTCHDICKFHHERWDGSGYPNHYSGEDIPLAAQVVGMSDTYDCLTSKAGFLHEQAIKFIKSGEAGSFSPVLLETINLIPHKLFNVKDECPV